MKPKFAIPKPCHEDWNDMTPEARGRFCQVCAKTVVDLRDKSPEQILDIYQKEEGNLCGRIKSSQLTRKESTAPVSKAPQTKAAPIISPFRFPRSKKRSPRLSPQFKNFAAAFFIAFAFLFANEADGQIIMGKVAPSHYSLNGTIHGIITDENGNPAKVKIYLLDQHGNQKNMSHTDEKGFYRFTGLRGGHYKLAVKNHFYSYYEVTLDLSKFPRHNARQNIVLTYNKEDMIKGDIQFIPEEDEYPDPIEDIPQTLDVPEETQEDLGRLAPVDEPEILINGAIEQVDIPELAPTEIQEVEKPRLFIREIIELNPTEKQNTIAGTSEESNPETPSKWPETSDNHQPEASPADNTPTQTTIETETLKAFPNPTTGTLSIELSPAIKTDKGTAPRELHLFDQKGTLLRITQIGGHFGNQINLDISELPAGTYILKDLDQNLAQKVVKL